MEIFTNYCIGDELLVWLLYWGMVDEMYYKENLMIMCEKVMNEYSFF